MNSQVVNTEVATGYIVLTDYAIVPGAAKAGSIHRGGVRQIRGVGCSGRGGKKKGVGVLCGTEL